MMNIWRKPGIVLVALACAAFALCGCAEDEKPPAKVPKGFEVPAGVTLTRAGAELPMGKTATVVYDPGGAASAISVRVDSAKVGSMDDFKFFSLDEKTKKSTPYYVNVTVKNRGPAGLGGATLPIYIHSSKNTVYPPNEVVGAFKPCPDPTLPKSFLPENIAKVCLVFLLPESEELQSIDLQPGEMRDAVIFTPQD